MATLEAIRIAPLNAFVLQRSIATRRRTLRGKCLLLFFFKTISKLIKLQEFQSHLTDGIFFLMVQTVDFRVFYPIDRRQFVDTHPNGSN